MEFYVLDQQKNVIPVGSDLARLVEFQKDFRNVVVKKDLVYPGVEVSTVFLGIKSFPGENTFFETVVFGGVLDGERERCCTWKQAEDLHERMVTRVKESE